MSAADAADLADAFEALPLGVAVFDAGGALRTCNDLFREMIGDAAPLAGEGGDWRLLTAAFDRQGIYGADGLSALHGLWEAGGGTTDLALVAREGGWHRAALRRTRRGGMTLTLRDISEERAALSENRVSEAFLRKILKTAPVSLLIYDMDANRTLYATPFSHEMFGALDGHIINTWAVPEERASYLDELMSAGRVDRRRITGLRADGAPFPGRISSRLIEHEGNRVIVASTADISVDLEREEQLSRLSARLTDAIEAIGQGFALWDAEDRLVTANRVLRRNSGPLGEAFAPGRTRAEVEAAAVAAGIPAACVPAQDGPFSFDWAGRSFQGLRRTTSEGGAVMVWSDVTAARRAEAELARSREAAFQNEKLTALGELLAGVAHELNNPLSVVVGQALMLGEDVEDPALAKRVARIGTAAERCSKIVKTFLAMARQKPAVLEPADLGAVLATAVEVSSMGPHAAHVSVRSDIDPGLPPVLCDRDQIAQVFANMMLNSAQALSGRPDAEIRLRAKPGAPGFVDAVVEDNGPGIPEGLRARVFEPFFTTKEVGTGTGVGLALSARIVATHGGEIVIGETEEGGARFTVSLPAAPAAGAGPRGPEAGARGRGHVLVVEDEDDVAETLLDVLSGAGLTAQRADSGEAALAILAEERFDAILSDLRMPGMGGRALSERIAEAHPEMLGRLAFVTGDAMSADAEAIRRTHGAVLIEKPVMPSELRALASRLIEGGAR